MNSHYVSVGHCHSIRATKIEKHGSHLPVSKIGVEVTER